eukprot:4565856-Ditylum_brightwellii.AAC.1
MKRRVCTTSVKKISEENRSAKKLYYLPAYMTSAVDTYISKFKKKEGRFLKSMHKCRQCIQNMESAKTKSDQVTTLNSKETPKKQKIVAKDTNVGVNTANTATITDKNAGWVINGTVVINNNFQGSPPNQDK